MSQGIWDKVVAFFCGNSSCDIYSDILSKEDDDPGRSRVAGERFHGGHSFLDNQVSVGPHSDTHVGMQHSDGPQVSAPPCSAPSASGAAMGCKRKSM